MLLKETALRQSVWLVEISGDRRDMDKRFSKNVQCNAIGINDFFFI